MAEVVKMPKLSDTMTEGVVAKWHKEVGDKVESGELLAEIETDKATMEFESFQDGILLYKGVEEGKAAEVDSVLAIFGEKGENYKDLLKNQSGGEKNQEAIDSLAKEEVKEKKVAQKDLSNVAAKIVRMPKLSDTMTEGTIAKWHKKIGDQVNSGELLAEIETDKATMEFESFDDGELLYIGVEDGKSAAVDSILAIIGEKGSNYQLLIDAEKEAGTQNDAVPPEKHESKQAPKVEPAIAASSNTVHQMQHASSNGRVKASPLAKRLAEEKNINLSSVQGSGEGGRIIKRDLENFVPASMGSGQGGLTTVSYEEHEVSQMRKTIAKRLSESKFSAPHFYLTIQIDMDNAIAARKAIMESSESKISFNDIVIKAAAAALHKHPEVNSSWLGDKVRINKHVNIGVAVAVEEGLLVPVVRFADTKSLFQINAEVKDYAEKAKNKKLQPQDWEGNTFTISNLGMFGIDEFTAIINPPDACIMAVGGISQVPVVKNGEIVPGNVMKVTLSCDHRVVDGAKGAAFLNTFKQFMENPITMFV